MSRAGKSMGEGLLEAAKSALRAIDYERQMRDHPVASQAAGLALLRAHGDLKARGWFRSFVTRRPVNANGEPLPWFTYGAISFLERRMDPSWRVFEYGSGHSTLWWAAHTRQVVAAEHHAGWVDEMRAKAPANATIVHRPLSEGLSYPDAPNLEGGGFDIIVIDGRERVWCAERCLDALRPGGVIVWDNSERERYAPGLQALADAGFRSVDFDGMGPINTYGWRTTVLYRDDNVVGL